MSIEVSAGIIRRADGRILICKRGEGRKNAHLWEFPGGKREEGENAADCLVRELQEELLLPIRNVQEVCTHEAQGIRFTFLTGETDAEPTMTEHEDARFVRPREMLTLPFCLADTAVAAALALNDPPLKHFFWDFDGTLIDTYPAMTHTLVRACGSLGVNLTTARALLLMKNNLTYAIETIAAEHGLTAKQLWAAWYAENERMDVAALRPIAGIPETMAKLTAMGGKHYLVTHRDRSALTMLRNAGLLELFTGIVTSEDGFARKPAPDSCLYLLHTYNVDPAAAVMIGDRPLDTAAGRAAGMLSCLLDEEKRFPDDGCELRVSAASQLPEVLCPAPIHNS